jgi:hypothetical protein
MTYSGPFKIVCPFLSFAHIHDSRLPCHIVLPFLQWVDGTFPPSSTSRFTTNSYTHQLKPPRESQRLFRTMAIPLISVALAQPFLSLFSLAALYLFLSTARSYYRLSHIPGPFLARFTNIPRFLWVWSNNAHNVHIALHRKYGPVVRFGPNMVSVASPEEISQIYGFKKPWLKVGRSFPFSLAMLSSLCGER